MFIKRFTTWNEFVDYADNAPSEMSSLDRQSRTENDPHYYSFVKAKDWKEVLSLARDGWPEGLKKVKEISGIMFNNVSQMIERVEVNHDIEGHLIDVSRFVDGEPECWMKFEDVIQEAQSGNKLIRITFNCTVSSGVSTDVIVRKGAAIAALIELLEYSGHRVELILIEAVAPSRSGTFTDNPSPEILVYINLKTFDQNSDMANISYALAHPSVSRALMFSVAETAPEETRKKCGIYKYGSYGSPTDIPKTEKGDIHIGHSRHGEPQWASEQAAEKWIIEQLAKQGVHLKETK